MTPVLSGKWCGRRSTTSFLEMSAEDGKSYSQWTRANGVLTPAQYVICHRNCGDKKTLSFFRHKLMGRRGPRGQKMKRLMNRARMGLWIMSRQILRSAKKQYKRMTVWVT